MRISHAGVIAPVRSFADMQATIDSSLAPINRAIGVESPVPVSVRLSQAALADPALTADSLRDELSSHGLTLAGVSGVGIRPGAKAEIHRPDWRSEERLEFMFGASNLMAHIIGSREWSEEDGETYSLTTNALSHRSMMDVDMPGNWTALTLNVVRIVQHLAGIRDRTGITIHIDLEAEPGSLLRNAGEIERFYTQWLLGRGAAMLSDRMQVEGGTAAESILRHVRLALDTAHAAVVFDDPAISLDRFAEIGIRIGRLQVSAALEVDVPADPAELRTHLQQLDSETLSQQVWAMRDGDIVARHEDLPDALAVIEESAGETWRIHTHAPVLADRYGIYRSTRDVTADWLKEISARGIDVPLLELRSANWVVLPADDRAPAEELVAREAEWVRGLIS